MQSKTLLDEVTAAMQQYRRVLPPGSYLFSPELLRGKMTGRIIENRSNFPDNYVSPNGPPVTFGFFPLGPVPQSLKGAPPSWLSGYPFLPELDRLTEAPDVFLQQLKEHVEARLRSEKPVAAGPAGDWPLFVEEAG